MADAVVGLIGQEKKAHDQLPSCIHITPRKSRAPVPSCIHITPRKGRAPAQKTPATPLGEQARPWQEDGAPAPVPARVAEATAALPAGRRFRGHVRLLGPAVLGVSLGGPALPGRVVAVLPAPGRVAGGGHEGGAAPVARRVGAADDAAVVAAVVGALAAGGAEGGGGPGARAVGGHEGLLVGAPAVGRVGAGGAVVVGAVLAAPLVPLEPKACAIPQLSFSVGLAPPSHLPHTPPSPCLPPWPRYSPRRASHSGSLVPVPSLPLHALLLLSSALLSFLSQFLPLPFYSKLSL